MPHGWVWFDLENTPHVLFLDPIIRHVQECGWRLEVSAKPQAQTLELAAARGLEVSVVGGGNFAGSLRKVVGGLGRSAALAAWVARRGRPRLLISSSRSAALTAYGLRIPAIGLLDYEHAHHVTLALACRSLWLPDVLQGVRLPPRTQRVARFYAGLKENLYLDRARLDRDRERAALGAQPSVSLVVARPPATTAHYARGPGMDLWVRIVAHLAERDQVLMLVSPRWPRQREALETMFAGVPRVRILDRVIPGPGLVAAADLVVGGGGTMNREAAVLGVPVWSVFTGPMPRIDERLAEEGRLRWIRAPEDVLAALAEPMPQHRSPRGPFPGGLTAILEDVDRVLS